MKNITRRFILGVTSIGLIFTPAYTVAAEETETSGASTTVQEVISSMDTSTEQSIDETPAVPYMETLNVKWDLKKNKKFQVKCRYAGVNKQKTTTVRITNFKVSNAEKKGYKKLTYTCTLSRPNWKPTAKEVYKMVNSKLYKKTGSFGNNILVGLLHYNTGKAAGNDIKVKNQYSYSNQKTFEGERGYKVTFAETKIKTIVLYPEKYTDLCLGVSGTNVTVLNKTDKSYINGTTEFGKTNFYKKNKNNSHFLRIR